MQVIIFVTLFHMLGGRFSLFRLAMAQGAANIRSSRVLGFVRCFVSGQCPHCLLETFARVDCIPAIQYCASHILFDQWVPVG